LPIRAGSRRPQLDSRGRELDLSPRSRLNGVGGTLRLTFEAERMTGINTGGGVQSQTVTRAVDPGQRSIVINGSDQPLTAGRYAVRAELTPQTAAHRYRSRRSRGSRGRGGRARAALRGRGPSTASSTWRPRIRASGALNDCVSAPLAAEGFTGTGRLLTRGASRRSL
jgi:hypothetical protein